MASGCTICAIITWWVPTSLVGLLGLGGGGSHGRGSTVQEFTKPVFRLGSPEAQENTRRILHLCLEVRGRRCTRLDGCVCV